MALNATQGWWIRAGGNTLNGGGFDIGSADLTYSAIAQTLTLSAKSGEGVTATAGGGTPFASGDVGKLIKDTTTGSIGLAQITGFTSSTVVTIRILKRFSSVSISSSSWSLSDQINYADQDAPQLSLTDIATTGVVTTITSVTGGFTSAMIGNILRIASGTNFTAGYYRITAVASSNSATVDRAPTTAAGSGGTGRLGGAFVTVEELATSSFTTPLPTITSPLLTDNWIHIRGAGTQNPSSADYTSTDGGWIALATCRMIGYNGRPLFSLNGLKFYSSALHVDSICFIANGASNPNYGFVNGATSIKNCQFDQAGYDIAGTAAIIVTQSEFINSGSTSAGTYSAISLSNFGNIAYRNYINGWRGYGILGTNGTIIVGNLIVNCKGTSTTNGGIYIQPRSFESFFISNNTLYGNAANGIVTNAEGDLSWGRIYNNILVNNGLYGVKLIGTVAVNENTSIDPPDFNAYYNNTSGPVSGIPLGSHDIILTGVPFTNAGAGDFSLNNTVNQGGACRATGMNTFRQNVTPTSYEDVGTLQHQDSGGGGGSLISGSRVYLGQSTPPY